MPSDTEVSQIYLYILASRRGALRYAMYPWLIKAVRNSSMAFRKLTKICDQYKPLFQNILGSYFGLVFGVIYTFPIYIKY